MDTLIKDLKYGLRGLVKRKGFAAIAVLTLALGIGANTAIFTLVNAVMLKSLPVHKPKELGSSPTRLVKERHCKTVPLPVNGTASPTRLTHTFAITTSRFRRSRQRAAAPAG